MKSKTADEKSCADENLNTRAWENVEWKKYENLGNFHFQESDFLETFDGGQAFTWYRIDEQKTDAKAAPEFFGTFKNCAVKLRLKKDGSLEISIPKNADAKKVKLSAQKYIDEERDYENLRAILAQTRDANMLNALKIYPTLRILRQDPSDAIISFICSSSKRIVQIKQCVKLLSLKLGKPIFPNAHTLPDFETLADTPIQILRDCKLGFRADYLKKSAQKIVADKFDPQSLREIPYPEAKKYLLTLSGIGEKVADCILLFGASRFQAFPVDTWIRQAMTSLYDLPDNPDKIRQFALNKFGDNAGFAQQLIFSSIRRNVRFD